MTMIQSKLDASTMFIFFLFSVTTQELEVCDKRNIFEETCSVNNSCLMTRNLRHPSSCPVMFQCSSSSKCECIIKNPVEFVKCNENLLTAEAVDDYGIMYHSESGSFVAGISFAHSIKIKPTNSLPKSINDLNASECDLWNRDGLFCGKCKEKFYPQAYSYNFTCIHKDKCSGKYGDLGIYILAAYGPLTLFYFVILLFRINVISSYLLAYVIYSQTITMPAILESAFSNSKFNKSVELGVKGLSWSYSIWNLDFFRSAYTICLKFDSLTITALNYGIALYPFLLTLISFQLIKVYDRKISFVTSAWKPIKWLFSSFHKNVNACTTVLDAYTTFFLLSYSKIAYTSFVLLTPTKLYILTTHKEKWVLFYDGTKEYFHREHLPYGILAILMSTVFNFLPLATLLFYHSKLFQVLLSYFPFNHLAFKTTMDLLQCCYRDGREPGTKDCRWFSAVFLVYWMVMYCTNALTKDVIGIIYGAVYCVVVLIVLMYIQPYKKKYSHFLKLHYALFLLLAVNFLVSSFLNLAITMKYAPGIFGLFLLALILNLFPHILLIVYTLYWLTTHWRKL